MRRFLLKATDFMLGKLHSLFVSTLGGGEEDVLFATVISRLLSPPPDDPNEDTTVMEDKKELKPPEESASKLEAAPESLDPVESFLAALNLPFKFSLALGCCFCFTVDLVAKVVGFL